MASSNKHILQVSTPITQNGPRPLEGSERPEAERHPAAPRHAPPISSHLLQRLLVRDPRRGAAGEEGVDQREEPAEHDAEEEVEEEDDEEEEEKDLPELGYNECRMDGESKVNCPSCDARLGVPRGSTPPFRFTCPQCGSKIRVVE